MEKVFVVQRLARQLWSTEAAVDAAIVEASTMMGDLVQGRKDLNVAPIFANDVNVKLMEAMRALQEARSAMVATHEAMTEAQLRLGVRKITMDWAKPAHASTTEETTLREVG